MLLFLKPIFQAHLMEIGPENTVNGCILMCHFCHLSPTFSHSTQLKQAYQEVSINCEVPTTKFSSHGDLQLAQDDACDVPLIAHVATTGVLAVTFQL